MPKLQWTTTRLVALGGGGAIVLVCGAVGMGFGEYAAMAIYAGMALGGLILAGLWAERRLAEPIGQAVRQFCLQAGAFAILVICVLSRFYPSSFTPDFMAPSITVSDLSDRAGELSGHKRRVEGRVGRVEIDREEPGGSFIVLRVQLTDLDGDIVVYCRHPRDAALPAPGSLVTLVGEIESDVHASGHALMADQLDVLQPPTYVVSAGGR